MTDHTGSKPTVLFLCVHNAGRSQMAMGFFRHLAGDGALAADRRHAATDDGVRLRVEIRATLAR